MSSFQWTLQLGLVTRCINGRGVLNLNIDGYPAVPKWKRLEWSVACHVWQRHPPWQHVLKSCTNGCLQKFLSLFAPNEFRKILKWNACEISVPAGLGLKTCRTLVTTVMIDHKPSSTMYPNSWSLLWYRWCIFLGSPSYARHPFWFADWRSVLFGMIFQFKQWLNLGWCRWN